MRWLMMSHLIKIYAVYKFSYFRLWYLKKGVVVEGLERLDYGAESRCKVVSSRLGFAMRRLENSLCQPSSKWVPFSN